MVVAMVRQVIFKLSNQLEIKVNVPIILYMCSYTHRGTILYNNTTKETAPA